MIHNLPNEPPFVPEVIVTDQFKDKVKYITGLLMKEVQNRAITDKTIMFNMYEHVSPNGYQNKYFPQLVQEVITILEYLVFERGEDYAKSLLKIVPMAVLSIAAILAKQKPNLMSQLPTALINNMNNASTQYINLQHTANTWRKGANMYANTNPQFTIAGYNHMGQPVNAYGQVIGNQPQQQYAVGANANPAALAAYGNQAAYMTPQQQALLAQQQQQQQQAIMAQQQQQAMLAQQQALMAQQQRQQSYVMGNQPYIAPTGNYVPQVAGGPRAGGFGSQDGGVTVTPVNGSTTSGYVPQVAGGPVHVVEVQHNTNQYSGQVAIPNTNQYSAPAAVAAPPVSIAPQQPTGNVNVQQVENGGEQWQLANDKTIYRCPGLNNEVVRIPYVFNVVNEKHEVIVVNGKAVKQRITDMGNQVQLSNHETCHYFTPRRKVDLGTPNEASFDAAMEKILNQTNITEINNKLNALPKEDEEALTKETAIIIRDATRGLIRIDKPIVTMMNSDWRVLAKNGLNPALGINPSKNAIAMQVIEVLPYQLSGGLISHAQRLTISSTLEQLHTNFTLLVNECDAVLSSKLIDMVTKFVNTELQKFFGLNITIDSFVLDFNDLMKLIESTESVEFKTIVSEHLVKRLTTTILYSYTSDNINQLCKSEVSKELDVRLFAVVNEVIMLPVHSRDIPYAYNGKSGLLLNTEYPKLTRAIETVLSEISAHAVDVRLVTLDGDELIISPILVDNSYVIYK